MTGLATELATAEVLITCTGSVGTLVGREMLATARAQAGDRPLAIVDLALPHDVDPTAADLPGVTVLGLAQLAEALHDGSDGRRRCSRCAGSSARRSPRSSPLAARPVSRRPWSRSARWPRPSSTPR